MSKNLKGINCPGLDLTYLVPDNIENGEGVSAIEQKDCVALGKNSFAIGCGTTAIGENAFIEGKGSSASASSTISAEIVEASNSTVIAKTGLKDGIALGGIEHNGFILKLDNGTFLPIASIDSIEDTDYTPIIPLPTKKKITMTVLSGYTVTSDLVGVKITDVILGAAMGAQSHVEGENNLAIGPTSHAEGYLTRAEGELSHTEGNNTTASGHNSHAEGNNTAASGENAHAEGLSTTASGDNAHTEGSSNNADGNSSHAEGNNNNASGYASHAEGGGTNATKDYAHAEGLSTTASGNGAHSEGYSTAASSNYAHAEGSQVLANGTAAHAEGYKTLASGDNSHAEGGYTIAGKHRQNAAGDYLDADGNVTTDPSKYVIIGGHNAHAEGRNTISSGACSHAEGNHTTASGDYSHAEGNRTNASGESSHAEGGGNTASGENAHAEGRNTTASGAHSHAEGLGTKATAANSHAEGHYTKAGIYKQDESGKYLDSDNKPTTDPSKYVILGVNSHAEGNSTTASGDCSHAEGNHTTASGDYSHVEGSETTASGAYSHAEGYCSNSSGTYSHAEGRGSCAKGMSSHAEGNSTTASGTNSHAEGDHTITAAANSHAEGEGSTVRAYGKASHAEGQGSIVGYESKWFTVNNVYIDTTNETYYFTLSDITGIKVGQTLKVSGYNNSYSINLDINIAITSIDTSNKRVYFSEYPDVLGNIDNATNVVLNNGKAYVNEHPELGSYGETIGAHAEGNSAAYGDYSHAEGNHTTASGDYSHAEGNGTTASATNSHAEGNSAKAFATNSHAEGNSTTASGTNAHAEGNSTTASGTNSHAEGYLTKASSANSHAEGAYTEATGEFQHVQGKYNKVDSTKAFIIGNGNGPEEQNRSNAMTVDWDGNGKFSGDVTTGNGNSIDGVADKLVDITAAINIDCDSICVIEETEADVSAADNSAHFDKTHLVVQKDTYKLDRDIMLSLQDKKLVGNGSVMWKDWNSIAQGWKDTFDPTMLSGALKVRYADDPVYLSMKLPSEANFAADTITRPGMRASDYAAANLVTVNNIGAIYPVDYTKLPDEIVICIGNLSLYTLSKEPNARWKLHDKCGVPAGSAMYSLPWSASHDAHVSIADSKVSVCDGYMRFTLTRDDFGPMGSVAGSLAKTLHFWGNHNKLDLMNNAAVITFCEVWVETPEAAGNLYVAPGCDRKSADSSIISQNFWGRNVLLSTGKQVITGHNISDALYEKMRDTPNDTRLVYADYASVHSTDYDLKLFQEKIENDLADKGVKMDACFSTLEITEVEKTGININPGIYETGYIAQAGTDYDGYHNQSFRTKGYIKVEAGRTIALYYNKAEWNGNDNGKAFEIVEYDINKTPLGQRQYFKSYVNSNSTFTLSADTAYIRITYNNWSAFTTPVSDIKAAIYYIEDARKEFVAYYADMEAVYGVKGNRVILTAPNGAQFSLSVGNDGTLKTNLIV